MISLSPSLSTLQQITLTMAQKQSQLKEGTPFSITPHAYVTLENLHNHIAQRAQGHDLIQTTWVLGTEEHKR